MRLPVLFLIASFTVGPGGASAAAEWHNVVSRTRVSDVLIDGDVIWLSYLGGGVARYEPRTGKAAYFTAADGLVHNYVTAATADQNKIYFASRNGLATLARASGEFKNTIRMWGFAHNDCTDAAVDDGYVYVATLEGARRFDKSWPEPVFEAVPAEVGPASRLSRQVEDGWKVYVNPDGVVLDDLYSVALANGAVYWGGRGRLFASARGAESWREVDAELPLLAVVRRVLARGERLIVATDEGVFEYDGSSTTRAPGPVGRADTRDALAFAGLEYYATAEGLFVRRADGEPFKFAAGAGASWKKLKDARRKESPWWRLGVGDGLPSSRCTALASWEESVVVGTEDGACLLEPASGKIRPLPLAKGLPPGGVYAVSHGDGRIWAATPNGLAAADEADFAVEKFELPGLWNDVRDVRHYGDEILITTRAGAAAVRRNRTGLKYTELCTIPGMGYDVEGLCAVKHEGLHFVGTTRGVVALDSNFELKRSYTHFPRYEGNPARGLLPSGPLMLCATQGGGLAYIYVSSGYFAVKKTGEGISSDVILSLAADEGHVYVGTYDKGVDVLDGELNFERNISWGDGLSHTDIWAEAVDPPWLWLAIRGVGINAFNLETGDVRRYYARYGLGDEYCKAIAVLPRRDGRKRIAFGTASGVAVLEYDGEPPAFTQDDYDRNYP